jgi:hypothetical protein
MKQNLPIIGPGPGKQLLRSLGACQHLPSRPVQAAEPPRDDGGRLSWT